jgi:osmotically-inducible protein OsmY
MKKLAFLALAAAGVYAAYAYFDRRAMALQRTRLAVPPSDEMLARRVRESLARVADPETIRVTVHERTVTLRGWVERTRRDRVLREALAVPGVKAVLNRFETDEPSGLIDDDSPELRPT